MLGGAFAESPFSGTETAQNTPKKIPALLSIDSSFISVWPLWFFGLCCQAGLRSRLLVQSLSKQQLTTANNLHQPEKKKEKRKNPKKMPVLILQAHAGVDLPQSQILVVGRVSVARPSP